MKKKMVSIVMFGIALGLPVMVLTGCDLDSESKEKKGGSITVVNTSDNDYYFGVYDPSNKNVTGTTHTVRAQGRTTVKVAKDDNYQIAYSTSSSLWWSGDKKYIDVSGGGSFTVQIP